MELEKKHTELKNPTYVLLLICAFFIALAFRLIRLGLLPLMDSEAQIALQALAIAQNGETTFGPFAAYNGLTGAVFYLFESTNFLARFWPAFVGALVVLVPFLWREKLGYRPAIALSFVLAFSPEMVGLSRIIGAPMMAFTGLLFALSFLFARKPVLTGIFLGLGLMSGAAFWMGMVILLVVILIGKWALKLDFLSMIKGEDFEFSFWIRLGLSFLSVIMVVGTGFFLEPAVLSGVFGGLSAFFKNITTFSGISMIQILLPLLAYTLPALLFGLWGTIRAFLVKEKTDLFFSIWWLTALIIILIFPGRQPGHIIWVTFPLWILSVRVFLFAWQIPEKKDRFIAAVTTVLIVVIMAFMGLSLRTLVTTAFEQGRQINFFLALIGGVVLLIAVVFLVSYGWSEEVALPGLLLALLIVFVAGLFSTSVNTTGLAPEPSFELWQPNSAHLSTDFLLESIDRIVGWNLAKGDPIRIVVSGFESSGLSWALRQYPVEFTTGLFPQSEPEMLITAVTEIPEIASTYRGQDLVWSRGVYWSDLSPFQYLNWVVTHQVNLIYQESIIFWVRTDLMPDSQYQ